MTPAANKRIVALPVDGRPVVRAQVAMLAKSVGWELALPAVADLGHFRFPADRDRLAAWLLRESAAADGVIVSLDMLLYGGLVPSRFIDDPLADLEKRLAILTALKRAAPGRRLYAFAATMRISNNNVADEEKPYWRDYGERLWRWSYWEDRAAQHGRAADTMADATVDVNTAADARAEIPAAIRDDYLATRARNFALTRQALALVQAGVIDRLILPQDDTADYGFNIAERRQLQREIAELNLQDRVLVYPGADEVLWTLTAQMVSTLEGLPPTTFYWHCSDPDHVSTMTARYEDRPLLQSLAAQVEAVGGRVVTTLAAADVVVALHTSGPAQGDWAMRIPVPKPQVLSSAWLESLAAFARAGKPVALLDAAYANGGDPAMVEALAKVLPLDRLTAYSGWNTASNSAGSLLAQCRLSAQVVEGGSELLCLRLTEDLVYQAILRQEIRDAIDEPALDKAALETTVAHRFESPANHWLIARGLGWRLYSIALPWQRTFEIDIALSQPDRPGKPEPESLLRAEIAVIGASLGGVLAVYRACLAGRRVVLVAEAGWLGGQLSAQLVPPDEHALIEAGGATASYRQFRRDIRAHYQRTPGFVDRTELTEGCNPGDGWVSRLCFEPKLAANYFEALLAPFQANRQLQILRDCSLVSARREGRRIAVVNVRVAGMGAVMLAADLFLDATDTGALIKAAGLDYRLGKEARSEFDEPDAPAVACRDDQQPVTWVMALRRVAQGAPIDKPADYAFWRDFVVPHYGYPLFSNQLPGRAGGSITLPFSGEGKTLDLWRYRRVVSARNWNDGRNDVSLINWAQNDFARAPLLDGAMAEAEVAAAAKALSRCLLYWLQTEAPRTDGEASGQGYPEWQLAPDISGTADGFAQQVYVRESRRIVGLECLTQGDILHRGGPLMPTAPVNSVGIAWYNMDIHPTCVTGHGVNARVRPFCLPLGCFVAVDCDNLIPACKNIGVTHLVNAATRVHPVEWLVGEVAGLLADFVLHGSATPATIHADGERVKAFQQTLTAAGIPLFWDAALLSTLSPTEQH